MPAASGSCPPISLNCNSKVPVTAGHLQMPAVSVAVKLPRAPAKGPSYLILWIHQNVPDGCIEHMVAGGAG